jgi:hypothetical protein
MIDICREGPMSQFSISLTRGSHQRKGADKHIIDMVWLYIACLSQWEHILLVQMISPSRRLEGMGGGVSTLCFRLLVLSDGITSNIEEGDR